MVERLILNAKISNKRQPDQWIFQPFRFVDGDDFNQMLIALQPQLLTGSIAVRFQNMLGKPAHQRMLTFQLRSRFLQQFTDMQNVGQTAFTTRRCQQVFCNLTR